MSSKPKVGVVSICDNAYRDATTGKTVIAGHYSGDVLVTEFPASFSAAFYIEILNPEELEPRLEFNILLGKKTIGRFIVQLEGESDGAAIIILPPGAVGIPGPTTFALSLKSGEGKPTIIVKKTIELADSDRVASITGNEAPS